MTKAAVNQFAMMPARSAFLIAAVLFSFSYGNTLSAQDGNVTFHQDVNLDGLVEFYSSHVRSHKLAPGYRIQILAGTSREKAHKVQRDFRIKYPAYDSYLTYHSPYFKIRVGDFTERLAAHRFLHEIESTFPGAFLVEEEIRLK